MDKGFIISFCVHLFNIFYDKKVKFPVKIYCSKIKTFFRSTNNHRFAAQIYIF